MKINQNTKLNLESINSLSKTINIISLSYSLLNRNIIKKSVVSTFNSFKQSSILSKSESKNNTSSKFKLKKKKSLEEYSITDINFSNVLVDLIAILLYIILNILLLPFFIIYKLFNK